MLAVCYIERCLPHRTRWQPVIEPNAAQCEVAAWRTDTVCWQADFLSQHYGAVGRPAVGPPTGEGANSTAKAAVGGSGSAFHAVRSPGQPAEADVRPASESAPAGRSSAGAAAASAVRAAAPPGAAAGAQGCGGTGQAPAPAGTAQGMDEQPCMGVQASPASGPAGAPDLRPSSGVGSEAGPGGRSATASSDLVRPMDLPVASGLSGDVRVVFEAAAIAGVRPEVLSAAARRMQALLQS